MPIISQTSVLQPIHAHTGNAIKTLCTKNNIQQNELAAHMGISVVFLNKLLNGHNRWKLEYIVAATSFFGTTPSNVLKDIGY